MTCAVPKCGKQKRGGEGRGGGGKLFVFEVGLTHLSDLPPSLAEDVWWRKETEEFACEELEQKSICCEN